MPKYYSLMLSPNISKTVQGYLICENVPLCRSGFQEYKGSELAGFPGYELDWGLEPEGRYQVYRSKEEVLHPDFIKSIEGTTVVDEHPDGSVVYVGNDGELNCGHVEKVGRGPDFDGEVTLKGDLHVKDPTLIGKIRPEEDPDADYAVRDISLGYSLKLRRSPEGIIEMYHLRGNHTAVVEKGRAGKLIAIHDSAIAEPEVAIAPVLPEIKPKKEHYMSLRAMIFGRGIKATAPDATPEEVALYMKELETETPAVKVAIDAAPTDPHQVALKSYIDKGGDKDNLMKFLNGEKIAIDADEGKESLEELEEETEEEAEEKNGKEKTAAEDEDIDNPGKSVLNEANDDDIDDPGESVLKQANDSIRNYIKTTKPMVALLVAKPKSKRNATEQIMIDSYNTVVNAVNKTGGKAYIALSRTRIPEGIPAVVTDSRSILKKDEVECHCFEGVPYRVGLAKHETAHQKGTK